MHSKTVRTFIAVAAVLWESSPTEAFALKVPSSRDRSPKVIRRGEESSNAAPILDDAELGLSTTTPISVAHTSSRDSILHVPTTIFSQGMPLYIFPTSTVQVPVATICPANSSDISSLSNTTSTTYSTATNFTFTGHPKPTSLSSTTTGVNTADTNQTGNTSPHLARIIMGDNECQTIYAPTTTATCSALIKLAGIPPVTVTDCDQWITFSSSSSLACTASTASSSILAASSTTDNNDPSLLSKRTADIPSPSLPALGQSIDTESIDNQARYYFFVAHWWDVQNNDVPQIVRVEQCHDNQTAGYMFNESSYTDNTANTTNSNVGSGTDNDVNIEKSCTTLSIESWSLSSVTRLSTRLTVTTWHGPVLFPPPPSTSTSTPESTLLLTNQIPVPSLTLTSTPSSTPSPSSPSSSSNTTTMLYMNITNTLTRTYTLITPTIIRHLVSPSPSPSSSIITTTSTQVQDDTTVTISVSVPLTSTLSLVRTGGSRTGTVNGDGDGEMTSTTTLQSLTTRTVTL